MWREEGLSVTMPAKCSGGGQSAIVLEMLREIKGDQALATGRNLAHYSKVFSRVRDHRAEFVCIQPRGRGEITGIALLVTFLLGATEYITMLGRERKAREDAQAALALERIRSVWTGGLCANRNVPTGDGISAGGIVPTNSETTGAACGQCRV